MSAWSSRCRWWMVGLVVFVGVVVMAVRPRAQSAPRPPVIGRTAAVSAGHPLTTAAAFEILTQGGDAGVAAMLVAGVLEQDLYSLGGERHALAYPRSSGKVVSINGQGWAPKGGSVDYFRSRKKTMAGGRIGSGGGAGRAACGADDPGAVGDDEFRARGRARD